MAIFFATLNFARVEKLVSDLRKWINEREVVTDGFKVSSLLEGPKQDCQISFLARLPQPIRH